MPEYTLQDDHSFAGGVPPTPFRIHESMIDKLDPEYVKFFNSTLSSNANIVYTHRVPLEELRSAGNVIPGQTPMNDMAKIFDIEIPRKHTQAPKPIPARVFVPHGEAPADGWPLVIWYHGGGWVLGGIGTENSYCTKVADNAKSIVVSVDYRLAPQDPYPAAVHDAYEALLWGFESGPTELGIDNTRICVAGSSAGGNLTGIVTHKYVNSEICKEFPPVKFHYMVVPVTDNTATAQTMPSWGENEHTPQLPAEKMLWYRRLYLQNGEHAEPESSPLFYPDESFAKLPPCFIACCECDVLRSEAEAYADKLKKNGVKTSIVIYPGMPHPAMVMDAVIPQGRDLVRDTTSAAREALYS